MSLNLILLLFAACHCRPLPPGDEQDGAAQAKVPKPSCYFALARFSPFEKEKTRAKLSEVSTTCSDDLRSMSTLLPNTAANLFGSFHRLDMALARGAATYISSAEDTSSWKDLHICSNHINELTTKWASRGTTNHLHFVKRGTSWYPGCSWPFGPHGPELKYPIEVSREMARAYLEATGNHVHLGIRICKTHADEMANAIEQCHDAPYVPEAESLSNSAASSQCSQFEQSPLTSALMAFVKAAGIDNFHAPRKPYSSLSPDTQRKKATVVHGICDAVMEIAAPREKNILSSRIGDRSAPRWNPRLSSQFDGIVEAIKEQYLRTTYPPDRDYVLSLLAGQLSYAEVERHISGVSVYKYYRARRAALSHREPIDLTQKKDRYEPLHVLEFIKYITSPHVLIGLPYGVRNARTTEGEYVEVPNTVRLAGAYEIIRSYHTYMKQRGLDKMILGNSTMFRILRALPATTRHSLSCVDSFLADAYTAFEDIYKMIDRLKELNWITTERAKELKYMFMENKMYIGGDYKLHVKANSLVADHSILLALSDPNDADFKIRADQQHEHDLQCPRCSAVVTSFRELNGELAMIKTKQDSSAEHLRILEEMEFEMEAHEEAVTNLKRHQLRSVHAHREKERIIESLAEGHAFVTVDFSQVSLNCVKWLPVYFNEKQEQYFGKRGISMHVLHVLARIEGQYVSHTIYHILQNDDQDSRAVVAIISHSLSLLKIMGIQSVHIRSDNAANYHSAYTLTAMPLLSKSTGVRVLSWSFSESQDGKSACDRESARAKNKMRRYWHQGNPVSTPFQMMKALCDGELLKGASFYRATVHDKNPYEAPKIAKIADYGHFDYLDDNTARVWKYHGIGGGKIVPGIDLTLSTPHLTVHQRNGELPGFMSTERTNIKEGKPARFWHWRPHELAQEEPDDTDDDVVGDESVSDVSSSGDTPKKALPSKDSLFYCWCGASFIRHANLMNHLEWGKHKIRPEHVALLDHALGLYKRQLEELQNSKSLLPLQDTTTPGLDSSIAILSEGWALRSRRSSSAYNPKARAFVVKYFEDQKKETKRADPDQAHKLMKKDTTIGLRERMTFAQVKSLIGRLAAEDKKKKDKAANSRFRRDVGEGDEVEDAEAEWATALCSSVEENDVAEDDQIYKHVLFNLAEFFEDPEAVFIAADNL